jgi:hypothetical protein
MDGWGVEMEGGDREPIKSRPERELLYLHRTIAGAGEVKLQQLQRRLSFPQQPQHETCLPGCSTPYQ